VIEPSLFPFTLFDSLTLKMVV